MGNPCMRWNSTQLFGITEEFQDYSRDTKYLGLPFNQSMVLKNGERHAGKTRHRKNIICG
jgi:hypothetical protein